MNGQDMDARFKELYRRYYRSVVAFFARRGFSLEEARDLAQETFCRVYEGMQKKTYRGNADRAYIEKTARNVAYNEIRRLHTQKRAANEIAIEALPLLESSFAKDPWTGEEPLSVEEGLVEEEEAAERRKRLYEAIAELPKNLQVCVMLRLAELSYREIQIALNTTMDTVKTRLHEARKLLKDKLTDEPEALGWPAKPPEDDDHDQEN